MVVAADEQLHRIFALAAGTRLAAGAAAGGLEFTHRHPLEVAGLGEQHHRPLVGDQVDVRQATAEVEDFGAARRRVALPQLAELVLDDPEHPLTPAKDVLVVGDLGDQILVLEPDLVGLKGGETTQLHLQDGVGLDVGEAMAILQLLPGRGRVGCSPDQGNDRIELIEGQQQAQQDVVALFGLAQQVAGAALDRLDPEVEEHLEHLAQGEQDRLTVHQRQHVGTEVALQRSELEQVVQHHLRVGVAAQLHNDPHAVAVALVADVGDALELLVVDQLSNALDQRRFVGLIRQLGDDHRIAIGPPRGLDRFDVGHAAHGHRAAAAQVGLADAFAPQDLTAGGEVRPGDQLDQLLIGDLRVRDQREQAINQFIEVVGRDVGRHPHGDARRTIQQQLRNPRRQHRGLLLGAIEVVGEINGLGLDVLQEAVGGEGLQPRFGVSHGRRRVVVHRAEVAVPIDQGHRHGEVLGHAHQGVVHSGVAVGVIFAEHFAHHTGALAVRPVAGEAQLVHRVENPAMHRLEAVAGIGQGPTHDHTHRVLQIGARHLVAQVRLNDPIVGIAGTAAARPHRIRHTCIRRPLSVYLGQWKQQKNPDKLPNAFN